MRCIHRHFALVVAARPRDPVRARLRARRHAARRADRAAVGRARAHLPAAPRDLVDQLASATSSAAGASPSTTTRRTSSGSRCRRSASPGTTTTTPSRARRSTGCGRGRSTSVGAGRARPAAASASPGTSSRSRPSARPAAQQRGRQPRSLSSGHVRRPAAFAVDAVREALDAAAELAVARGQPRPRSGCATTRSSPRSRASGGCGRRGSRASAASPSCRASCRPPTAGSALHGNYPHHRAALLRVLGERDPVGAARAGARVELEDAIFAHGRLRGRGPHARPSGQRAVVRATVAP